MVGRREQRRQRGEVVGGCSWWSLAANKEIKMEKKKKWGLARRQGRADHESGVEVKGLDGRLVTTQEADHG